MKIRKPQEMGLPPHITEWRAGQEEFIHAGLTDRARTTALCAPTGFGKTDAEIGIAIESKLPTCIVTNSKGLQDQIMKKYADMGIVDIRGRVNYTCDMRQGYTCQDGYSANCPYKNTPGCPSSHAEMKASVAPIVTTNYDKWMAAKAFSTGMTHFKQVIFDEAHHAPTAIAQAMQVFISAHEINEILHVDFPPVELRDTVDGWKDWAIETREIAEEEMRITNTEIKSTAQPKLSWIRHYNHMKELVKRLGLVSTARSKDWVVEEIEGGFQFDPISPGRYVESALLFRIPRVIMASATLRPKTLAMSGISRRLSIFKEFDSSFDRKRSPVYWIRTMKCDWKHRHEMHAVWNRLDQIASRRRDRKGIVHTVSYARRNDIFAHSNFSHSMIYNDKGEGITTKIDEFKNSGAGNIFISPTVSTGYDFPGNECEWQFICKIPFQPGRTKIAKERQQRDREYGAYLAMQSLVQMVGRGTRSETDQCENFIPDDNCEWFIPQFAHLAPKSFYGDMRNNIQGFYKRIDILPTPPPRLGD